MRDKIRAVLPNDKHIFKQIDYREIHVVDWKNFDQTRGVEAFDKKQAEISSVCLMNENKIQVTIDIFGENALPIKKGKQAEQCECIIFPDLNGEIWILAIETKYANNEEAAFRIRKDQNYPEKMVSQIVSTIDYFREKNIIEKDRLVHAIISFPNLVTDFNSTLFSNVKRDEWSIENLMVKKKIRIKGCNSAKIISGKRIRLG